MKYFTVQIPKSYQEDLQRIQQTISKSKDPSVVKLELDKAVAIISSFPGIINSACKYAADKV